MPTYLNVQPTNSQRKPSMSLADGYFMDRPQIVANEHHHVATCNECIEQIKQICSRQPILSADVKTAIKSVDALPNLTLALFWLNIAVIVINIILRFR